MLKNFFDVCRLSVGACPLRQVRKEENASVHFYFIPKQFFFRKYSSRLKASLKKSIGLFSVIYTNYLDGLSDGGQTV